MDWVGILFFILAMVFKAFSDSEKQKKRRKSKEAGLPPVDTPDMAEPLSPEKTVPPVLIPDLGLPPIFEVLGLEEEDEEETEIEEKHPEEKLIRPEKQEKAPLKVELKPEPVASGIAEKTVTGLKGTPLELHPGQVMQGIVWSEILQPPRAKRPYGWRAQGRR